MKKIAMIMSLAVVGLSSSVAMASYTSYDRIAEMRQSRESYDDGKTVIKLQSNASDTVCPSGDFFIDKDSSGRPWQLAMLTAAVQSGRQVQLLYRYLGPGQGCDVYAVAIK